jgi:membrane-bound ClpP family serine protease
MRNGQLITGIFLILCGIAFFVASFFESFVLLIYSVLLIILGLIILLNKKEDMIEGRKDLNKTKTKR